MYDGVGISRVEGKNQRACVISGVISVPGLGPFTFHQSLPLIASLLTEISAFAVLGGLVGAMLGPGIPEDEVRQYARNIRQGKVLVAILANREMVDQKLFNNSTKRTKSGKR